MQAPEKLSKMRLKIPLGGRIFKRVQREAKISHPISTSITLPPGMIEMHLSVQL